jgi:hypothetical protein
MLELEATHLLGVSSSDESTFDSDGLLRFRGRGLRTTKRRVEDVDPKRGS